MMFRILFYLLILLLFGGFIYSIYYNASKYWVKEKIKSTKEEIKLRKQMEKFNKGVK